MARTKHLFSLSLPLKSSTTDASEEPFHAVEIHLRRSACDAARQVSGRRYLSAEAPLLPLADCDQPTLCSCRYRHYSDRRDGPRRDAEVGLPGKGAKRGHERRCTQGRRLEDDPTRDDTLVDTYYDYVGKIGD
jgi:hypothetical protein